MDLRDRDQMMCARAWIDSPALSRLVSRVVTRHRILDGDFQDLLQETRIALWKSGNERSVSTAWISRVVTNKAVDLLRRTTRARARERAYASLVRKAGREPDIELLLHARVAEFPARLRRFYDLHYGEGWSERELAARLGMCRASIRWLDRCCRRAITGKSDESVPSRIRVSARG